MAESEADLQSMLNVLAKWCSDWDIMINMKKSQIVHFRQHSTKQTEYMFTVNDSPMLVVNQYKYLGLVLDYKLDYRVTAKAVAKSATRALGLLIAKAKVLGGLAFKCFTKLYESMVVRIMRYGASIWGHKEYDCINAVHNRMCRFFLGVGKFTPSAAVQGDMGVRVPWQHQCEEIARQWYRIGNMENMRVNKKVFLWAGTFRKNWISKTKELLNTCNLGELINLDGVDKSGFLEAMKENSERIVINKWLAVIQRESSKCKKGKNKLRTYNQFKNTFTSECYVYTVMPKSHRSALAQFRCGTAPIRIETGRYEGLPEEERICKICNLKVESEMHVLLECNLYDDLRQELFRKFTTKYEDFMNFSSLQKLKMILGCNDETLVKDCAKTCHFILTRRRQHLYK